MRKTLIIAAVTAVLGLGLPAAFPGGGPVYAQQSGDIAGTLARLKNNPRYRGRILGTHIKPQGRGFLYEVRILRPDDRVILVYIDPQTGGVVGDSERSQGLDRGRGNREDTERFNRGRGDRDFRGRGNSEPRGRGRGNRGRDR